MNCQACANVALLHMVFILNFKLCMHAVCMGCITCCARFDEHACNHAPHSLCIETTMAGHFVLWPYDGIAVMVCYGCNSKTDMCSTFHA